MSIDSVSPTTGNTTLAPIGSAADLNRLEEEKKAVEEEIDDLKDSDNASADNLMVLQNKLTVIEMKIAMEEAKQTKQQKASGEQTPESTPDQNTDWEDGIDVQA